LAQDSDELDGQILSHIDKCERLKNKIIIKYVLTNGHFMNIAGSFEPYFKQIFLCKSLAD